MSASQKEAPLGEWSSPISSELIVSRTLGLGAPSALPNGTLTWAEMRPSEAGRTVIAARLPGSPSHVDVTPPPSSGINVRTRCHEYGGGEHLLLTDGRLVFSNFSDQRVYLQPLLPQGSPPEPLTAECSGQRFADYCHDAARNRLLAVCEDHSDKEAKEPTNFLAAIDLATGAMVQLAGGHDFYSAPRLSPCGGRVAWIQWDHPAMPWDATELVLADVAPDGALTGHRVISGGPHESVQQPQWGPDGSLYFVSDKTNWWNLYCLDPDGQVTAVLPMDAEFGSPPWTLGLRTYCIMPPASDAASGAASGAPAGRRLLLAGYGGPSTGGSCLGLIDADSHNLVKLNCGMSATRGGDRKSVV